MAAAFQLAVLLLISVTIQCGKMNASNYDHDTYDVLDSNLQKQADAINLCPVCKSITRQVLKIIGNSLSKNDIDAALDGICSKIGLRAVCRSFIRKYRQRLINAIAAGRGVNGVCKSLNLCKRPLDF